MGKPSVPTPPTPPSQQEIAAATADTAEHMARLQRAMEFGEEMLLHEVADDGTITRYEKTQTEIPTGYEPVYSDEEIQVRGPASIVVDRADYRYRGTGRTVDFDGSGNLTQGVKVGNKEFPSGTHWSELDPVIRRQTGHKYDSAFSGSRAMTQSVKTLSGYESPTGPPLKANTYSKVVRQPDGTTTRTSVDRDEAVDVDFTGVGDLDRALKRWEFEKETSKDVADFMLQMEDEYGGEYVDRARELMIRSDPTAHAAREMLGQLARDYKPGELPDLPELQKMADPALLERMGFPVDLPEIGLGDVPEYERAGAFGDLGRLGAEPTLEELSRGEAPGLERAGEMDALRRAEAAPEFGQVGAGPELERAVAMGDLERLAAFGGLERAEGIGDIQRAGEMAALERAEAAPTLERLAAEDIPEIPIDPESLAGRQFAERQFLDRAQSGRTAQLMGERARRLARGRAAGLGNIFGGGAVIEESTQIQEAEDAANRAAMGDYMGFVQSGQTAGDYQARVAGENLRRRLMGIEQRTGAETGEFGMGMQRLGVDREAALQERADQLGAIGQRNQAEEQEYRAALQTLEANRQAGLQEYGLESQRRSFANEQQMRERADQLAAIGQRTGAEQQEYQNLLTQMEQQNTAMERGFQVDIQAAGFDNEAALRERTDQLSAIAQRTGAEQQEFANLGQIVSQMNQARTGQFGMGGQRLEANTMQRMRERQDELGALAQRNQAEEAEYQGLLSALGQQAGTRQAQYGLDMQGVQQRNVAAQQDLAAQQQAMAQRNQAAQQSFASAMQKAGTQEQMKQQQMANLQSFSGLAPVASQFGMLPGAQQAAQANFMPLQYQPTNAMGLLQGQQNLAQQQFGTQAGMWGQQAKIASQPSGFGQLLGTVAGGWAGSASGGAAITKKLGW